MKVLMVIPSLECGGAERNLTLMANYWVSNGWEVMVVKLDKSENEPFFALDPRVEICSLGVLRSKRGIIRSGISIALGVLPLCRAIRAYNPKLVISFVNGANLLSLVATNLGSDIPLVLTEHTHPSYYSRFSVGRFLRLSPYHFARAIVVNNEQSERWLKSLGLTAIYRIPNPVEKLNVEDAPRTDSRFNFVSVGRLVH